MLKLTRIAVVALSLSVAPACKNNNTEVVEPQSTAIKPLPYREAVTVPTITASITGVSGFTSFFSSHGLYNSYNAIDYTGTTLTIVGTGFGSSKGTVTFDNSGYYVSSTSWSDTKIIIVAKSTTSATNSISVSLTVTPVSETKTTRRSGSKAYDLVPTITSKVLNECTHHANKRKIETGGTPQPVGGSWTSTSGTIDIGYVPQSNHIWIFGKAHQCFVESVVSKIEDPIMGTKIVNKVKTTYVISTSITYTISLSERNINNKGEFSTYSNVVKITTDAATQKKTMTGSFRSNMKTPASSYYK